MALACSSDRFFVVSIDGSVHAIDAGDPTDVVILPGGRFAVGVEPIVAGTDARLFIATRDADTLSGLIYALSPSGALSVVSGSMLLSR